MLRLAIPLLLLLLAAPAPAHANPRTMLERCLQVDDPAALLARLGTIQKTEPIGKRPASELLHVIGTKARGYALLRGDTCSLVVVEGKPLAFLKTGLGGKAAVAYVLRGQDCFPVCPVVVSLKTADDQLLDVLPLATDCEDGAELAAFGAFSDRKSMKLGCWNSGGADRNRTDLLVDFDGTSLAVLATVEAGVAWIQLNDDGAPPTCTARPPGGLEPVKRSATAPIIRTSRMATPEEATAANIDYLSGGCEATVATVQQVYDATTRTFAPRGKPAISVRKKLCACNKR